MGYLSIEKKGKPPIRLCAYRLLSAKRKIGIWRRVAADNALRTAGGHSTSFGPLDRRPVAAADTSRTQAVNPHPLGPSTGTA